MKPTPKKQSGFTLIEIVIVLAIAALIMVIVFLAVQGAQRSRRDTQRKNDLAKVAAQLESFSSGNSGSYPANIGSCSTSTSFAAKYVCSSDYKDPLANTTYTFTDSTDVAAQTCTAPTSSAAATIYYQYINARSYKMKICLESGDFGTGQPTYP